MELRFHSMAKRLSTILKEYRKKNKFSQLSLAIKLGVTQATISRIESSRQDASDETFSKIIELIDEASGLKEEKTRKELPFEIFSDSQINNFKIKSSLFHPDTFNFFSGRPILKEEGVSLKEGFNLSYSIYGDSVFGGDFVRYISGTARTSLKSSFILGDTVGHGMGSHYMAFALEFGFESIVSTYNESILSPILIENIISKSIAKTSDKWKGEPSLVVGEINYVNSSVDFINRGMPFPIMRKGQRVELVKEGRYKAVNFEESISNAKSSTTIGLSHGDTIMFLSDGLADLFEDKEIVDIFKSSSRLFAGDSKAISKSFQRAIEKKAEQSKFERKEMDDMSFFVVSRRSKKKRK